MLLLRRIFAIKHPEYFKMKRIATLSLLLALTAGSFAQNGAAKNDPSAKVVLDKVSAKFKTYKSVQANFTLQVENASGKVLGTKKGTVEMKGAKYHVNITDQEIFCDGKNIWTYDPSANEVQISKVDPAANMITPQKLFSNFYDKDFLYKMNGEKKQGPKTLQEIELTPVDKSKPFHKVLVWVDKATQTIYSTKVMEKSGNRFTYTVSSLNGAAAVPDAQFVFNAAKYPGVEVIDLR